MIKTDWIDWWKAARLMLLSRSLDRLEVEQLTPQGKVKYQFSASGHELAQVLLGLSLDSPARRRHSLLPLATAAAGQRSDASRSARRRVSPLRQPHSGERRRSDVQPACPHRRNNPAGLG